MCVFFSGFNGLRVRVTKRPYTCDVIRSLIENYYKRTIYSFDSNSLIRDSKYYRLTRCFYFLNIRF